MVNGGPSVVVGGDGSVGIVTVVDSVVGGGGFVGSVGTVETVVGSVVGSLVVGTVVGSVGGSLVVDSVVGSVVGSVGSLVVVVAGVSGNTLSSVQVTVSTASRFSGFGQS